MPRWNYSFTSNRPRPVLHTNMNSRLVIRTVFEALHPFAACLLPVWQLPIDILSNRGGTAQYKPSHLLMLGCNGPFVPVCWPCRKDWVFWSSLRAFSSLSNSLPFRYIIPCLILHRIVAVRSNKFKWKSLPATDKPRSVHHLILLVCHLKLTAP